MRMRYERRDPRPEDLRQIDELKSIVESQDRDLRLLTERFREIQLTLQKDCPNTKLDILQMPSDIHTLQELHNKSKPATPNQLHHQRQPTPPNSDASTPSIQSMTSSRSQSPQQKQQQIPPPRKGKNRNKQPNSNNNSNNNLHSFHNSNQIINANNTHNQTEQTQHLNNRNAPTIIIPSTPLPAPQPPLTLLRTNCDVIYEENETENDMDMCADEDEVPPIYSIHANIYEEVMDDVEDVNSSDEEQIKNLSTHIETDNNAGAILTN